MKKVLLLGLCCLCLCGCKPSGTVNHLNDNSEDIETFKETNQNKPIFKIGDNLRMTTDYDGEYRFKVTSVKETSDRNEFSDKQADRVIIIEYEYENLSMEDDLNVDEFNFKLYDKDNNVLETYPADTKYSTSISAGRKATASVAYALNNENNYVEMEFYLNMFDTQSAAIIILEW